MDIKLDASHDLSNPLRQDSLREQLNQVDFIAAAFDCSVVLERSLVHSRMGVPLLSPFDPRPGQRDWRG